MRRFFAMLVVLVGLIGAVAPAFACASAAGGDCCPANAPSGCAPQYQPAFAVETGRELQVAQRDLGSVDPVVPTNTPAAFLDPQRASRLAVPLLSAACTDASLTYLHTGRLRL
jgi:hypothetical protein